MNQAILVLNAGSSSLKFALYRADDLAALCRGGIDGIGKSAKLKLNEAPAAVMAAVGEAPAGEGHDGIKAWLIARLEAAFPGLELAAAGHRVVHGGREFAAPVIVTPDILKRLERFIPLAPSHQPHNLASIRAVSARWPELPQVACFDTEFHRTQPRVAQLFALPRPLTDEGVLRYGFHGLSYEYIASVLPGIAEAKAEGRVIVAHLGHGASMCAMKGRKSIATTMGFTATDGLPMGDRCGALDPGVVLHLIEQKGMSPREVGDLLNKRSGLLGVSGISDDVRELEASCRPEATEALELFAYRAARELGSLVAALGGLDVLVFTAGIGEHSALLRRRICALSAWVGIEIDPAANDRHATQINSGRSAVGVCVIPTNEELVIARATRRLVNLEGGIS